MNDTEALIFLCQCLGSSNEPEQDRKRLFDKIDSGKVSWESVIRVSSENSFFMSIALFRALEDKKLLDLLPEGLHEYFLEIRDLNATRNERLKKQIIEISKILNEVGIEPILIKGAANLMAGLYPDPAMRVLGDLDILTLEEESLKALDALYKAGYKRSEKSLHSGDFQNIQELGLQSEGQLGLIDLHRYLHQPKKGNILNNREIHTNSNLIEIDGARFRIPSATDCIKTHIGHSFNSAKNNQLFLYDIQLRDLYDCYLISDRSYHYVDWQEIIQQFRKSGQQKYLRNYCLFIEFLFGKENPLEGGTHSLFWLYKQLSFLSISYPLIKITDRILLGFFRSMIQFFSADELGREKRKKMASLKWYKLQLKNIIFGFRNPTKIYGRFSSSDQSSKSSDYLKDKDN